MFLKISCKVLLLTCIFAGVTLADELEFEGTVFRTDANTLTFKVPSDAKRVNMPRFAASIRKISWLDDQGSKIASDVALKLVPEPDYWGLSWKSVADNASSVEIAFDSPPKLLKQIGPATAAGDGSIMLKACWASTSGEKLRYEPQSYKNTVGYWTKPGDFATWRLQVEKPGKYGVNILQGCGKKQGGSEAILELFQDGKRTNHIGFEVQETGHFQNFIWRNLGEISIGEGGVFELKVSPVKIAKAALMDVRAIHLVKLPN